MTGDKVADMFPELGTFVMTKQQRELYKAGELWGDWLKRYPEFFDDNDRQFFHNQAVFGYGFVEVLAMIFIYNSTGYIPMFGSYGMQTHPHKNALVKSLVSKETWKLVTYKGGSQPMPPDVFAYTPDKSDYFFCEVKGPGDHLRETQAKYFQLLQEVSGKPVYTIKYKFASFKSSN